MCCDCLSGLKDQTSYCEAWHFHVAKTHHSFSNVVLDQRSLALSFDSCRVGIDSCATLSNSLKTKKDDFTLLYFQDGILFKNIGFGECG